MTSLRDYVSIEWREFAHLEQLQGENRAAYKQLVADYESEFKPRNKLERGVVSRLATLRFSIDRIRECEMAARQGAQALGYLTPKMQAAIDELSGYYRYLTERYDHFFLVMRRLNHPKKAA